MWMIIPFMLRELKDGVNYFPTRSAFLLPFRNVIFQVLSVQPQRIKI